MPIIAAAVTDADNFFLALWEYILPWGLPLALLALLVAFRGMVAEWAAEAVFIYRRRLERLEEPIRARKSARKAAKRLWGDFCAWQTARAQNAGEESAAALDCLIEDLRFARLFAGKETAEKLSAWEKAAAAARAENSPESAETLRALLEEGIAGLAGNPGK